MAFGSQDVATFFADGSTCVFGDGTSMKCHLDFPEDLEGFGGQSHAGVVSAKPLMTYATSQGAGKVIGGQTVKIDGDPFKLGTPRKQNDGLISAVELIRAGS